MASAAITFSGFNNVDFNVVLNSLMTVASQPLTTLQSRQKDLQSQVTTFATLNTRLQSLQNASKELSTLSSLNAFAATSSNPSSLGVSVGSSATAGHYDVVVNDLARAQVTVSTNSSPDADSTIIASGGSITIGGKSVAPSGDVTFQGLADAINSTEDIGVHAAVVRTGTATYRLALTSTATGAANAFEINNQLSGGAGLEFTDTDDDGISGNSAADNAVSASDASLLVNSIPVTSASNTFADVIPGLTFTAYVKDPSATIRIDVASDATALTSKLQTFVSTYNDLAKFVTDQRSSAANGDTRSIGRDPLLRQISSTLRSALLGGYGSGDMSRLSQAGVTFTQSGTMELDQPLLSSALAADPDAVRSLFGGTDGAFKAVNTLVSTYAQSTGLVSSAKDHLTTRIKSMNDQISQLQARLALQREALQKQFIQADQAMSRLKDQQSSLSSLSSSLGSL